MKYSGTPVIFRKWYRKEDGAGEGNDIIALFPTELGTNDPYTCFSYEHIGQHGSAEPIGIIQRTKAAKPAEYADLLAELKGVGYDDLKVYAKYQYDFLRERERKLAGMDNPQPAKRPVKKSSKPRKKSQSIHTTLGSLR